MHPATGLDPKRLQLDCHPLALRFALYDEASVPSPPIDLSLAKTRIYSCETPSTCDAVVFKELLGVDIQTAYQISRVFGWQQPDPDL